MSDKPHHPRSLQYSSTPNPPFLLEVTNGTTILRILGTHFACRSDNRTKHRSRNLISESIGSISVAAAWHRTFYCEKCLRRRIPWPGKYVDFHNSPVTGAPISGQSRHTAVARSPFSGTIADSQCGGWWGVELKFAGWDGIIIKGCFFQTGLSLY